MNNLEIENKRLYKIIEEKEERIEDLLDRLDEVTKGYQKLLEKFLQIIKNIKTCVALNN